MGHTARDLSDDRWKVLGPLIPKPKRRNDGRGRPWKSRRSVLNGILWVLRTGAPWADLPEACPISNLPPSLSAMGALWRDEGILEVLASELKLRRVIDVQEAFIDATV